MTEILMRIKICKKHNVTHAFLANISVKKEDIGTSNWLPVKSVLYVCFPRHTTTFYTIHFILHYCTFFVVCLEWGKKNFEVECDVKTH